MAPTISDRLLIWPLEVKESKLNYSNSHLSRSQVLECHAFVCKRETAANALVRCCFHAYADNEYVKQMDESPYAQIHNRTGGETGKDQLDAKYGTSNWDNADVTDSDNNTASSTQPGHQKLNCSLANSTTNSKAKLLNGQRSNAPNGKSNGFANPAELNSDDTEIMTTTNSSISQNSPEEDEDVALINSYKIWPTSKSLSGSVKNLNLSSKEAAKVAKGASMRSLRPRQMVMPNMLPPPMPFIPIHAIPHPFYPHPLIDKPPKSKLLKKMKSKSMITLVPQNTPIPSHAIPIGQAPPFLQQSFNGKQQQMMLINPHAHHPAYGPPPQMLPPMIPIAGTPQPITGNLHSIKKKSKKSKEEKKLLQQQLNEMQFLGQHPGQHLGQHPPIYIPPMRPLTPLANYLGNQSPINQKYLIQTIGPQGLGSIYHTAPRNRKESKKLSKKEKDKLSAIDADELQAMINNQNLANYHNQQQQQAAQQSANNRSNSPFNTGIYRKGHLNERAFSYSIRQEHRSRSNSVANLNFSPDEVDHHPAEPQDIQHLLNGGGQHPPQLRKLPMPNGSAGMLPNHSNSSQGSPSSISKQQQLARQQQAQQYYLHQQQLSDALNSLQLNAQPKTASIKRSKLNNNNLLFHNGQLNGGLNGSASSGKLRNGSYDSSSNHQLMPPVPINGKLVLPHHQNGNAPFDQRPESMKKKIK